MASKDKARMAGENYRVLFTSAWTFTRSLTREMLQVMDKEDLLFSPGHGLGAFWKQYRHVGRVQECYIEALTTKKINFTPEGKSYDRGPSKKWLEAYLDRLDDGLYDVIDKLDWDSNIDWFGENVRVFDHMMRMESHETLHHGQWIVYMHLLGKEFPPAWEAWGL